MEIVEWLHLQIVSNNWCFITIVKWKLFIHEFIEYRCMFDIQFSLFISCIFQFLLILSTIPFSSFNNSYFILDRSTIRYNLRMFVNRFWYVCSPFFHKNISRYISIWNQSFSTFLCMFDMKSDFFWHLIYKLRFDNKHSLNL